MRINFPLSFLTGLNNTKIFDDNSVFGNKLLVQARNKTSIVAMNVKGSQLGLRASLQSQIYLASGNVSSVNANATDSSRVVIGRLVGIANPPQIIVLRNSVVNAVGRRLYRSGV